MIIFGKIMKKDTTKQHILFSVAGLLSGALLIGIGVIIIYLSGSIKWMMYGFEAGHLVMGTALMLLISAAEEYIFRGIILRRLGRKINMWPALLISAVLFAAVHIMNTDITPLAIVNIFLGGLVFGIAYMFTRSLSYVIFFHFGWNFIQGPILGFTVSGLPFESIFTIKLEQNNLINGGAFGFEGSIVCSIILLITFLIGVALIEK
jgi:uncharacterized protein